MHRVLLLNLNSCIIHFPAPPPFFFKKFTFFYLFIYLFMTMLGFRFCARAFSGCGKWGPLFIAVRGPLTIAASPVAKHRLQTRRLSNCGSRAQPLRGMWDLPRPGLEPVSPALAGRFSTTGPPGKPPAPLLTWPVLTLSHRACPPAPPHVLMADLMLFGGTLYHSLLFSSSHCYQVKFN